MSNLTQGAMDHARELASWRPELPWWIVLVEGSVLAVLGALILIDPDKTAINMSLTMAAALGLFGFLHLWTVFRNRIPEGIEATVASRGAVGALTSIYILLLYFLNLLTVESGVVMFGIGGLISGLMGFRVSFGLEDRRDR